METGDLAKRLKNFRAKRGMSQEYLAEESRVSLRTIQRIENQESRPTGETVKRIAVALGVEINELTGSIEFAETDDLDATIIFLKKQLSRTTEESEIKTFEKFIELLQRLKEKDLNAEQIEGIESYLRYLELEKIPTFSNEIFHQKLTMFKRYLKNKLGLVPINQYSIWTASFGIAFAAGFAFQNGISSTIKLGVFSGILLIVGGILMDLRIKRQDRSFKF